MFCLWHVNITSQTPVGEKSSRREITSLPSKVLSRGKRAIFGLPSYKEMDRKSEEFLNPIAVG